MVLPQTVHFFLPSYTACGILVPNWGLGPAVEAEPPAGRRGAPSAVVLRGSASVHGGVRGAGTRVSFPSTLAVSSPQSEHTAQLSDERRVLPQPPSLEKSGNVSLHVYWILRGQRAEGRTKGRRW